MQCVTHNSFVQTSLSSMKLNILATKSADMSGKSPLFLLRPVSDCYCYPQQLATQANLRDGSPKFAACDVAWSRVPARGRLNCVPLFFIRTARFPRSLMNMGLSIHQSTVWFNANVRNANFGGNEQTAPLGEGDG